MKISSFVPIVLLAPSALSLTIRGSDGEESLRQEPQVPNEWEEWEEPAGQDPQGVPDEWKETEGQDPQIPNEGEEPAGQDTKIPNEFRNGCSDAAGTKLSLRPIGQNSRTTAVRARCANPFFPNPQSYIVGTNDPDCELDVVESCDVRMSDNSVTCDVTVAPLNLQDGNCDYVAVTSTIHILCCN